MKAARFTFLDHLRIRGEPAVFYFGATFIVVACLIAYLPALNGGFIWDDDVSLYNNPLIRSPNGLKYIWLTTKPYDYFPLTYSSFWFEWRLWEANPLGYHVINILLHGAGAALLWRVLREMKIPGSWWTGLIFALHPVCVASVAWITERKNTLSIVFCLLSFLWYLRFVEQGRWRFFAVSLGAFLLALLSKSSVAMLPVILLAWHWWQQQRQPQRPVPWKKWGLSLAPFFGMSLLFGLVTIWFQTHRAIGSQSVQLDPLLKRVLAGSWTTWLYLEKLFWPVNLSMVYPRLDVDPGVWWNYLPAVAWLMVIGVGFYFRKTWGKHLCFVTVCFLANLLPVIGFIPMYYFNYSQMADHWQYLAMLAILASFTGILFRGASPENILTPATAGAAFVAIFLGALTWRQASVYKNSRTLWEDVIRKNPNSWVACNNLAGQLTDPQATEALYEKALSLNPTSALTFNNLGISAVRRGRLDEAVVFFEKALNLEPQYGDAHSNLGSILLRLNRIDEAMPHLERGLQLRPNSANAYSNLGDAKYKLNQWQDAIQLYQAALRLNPGMCEALSGLGCVLLANSKPNEAVPYFAAAIKAQPNFPGARVGLGAAMVELGKYDEAIQWLESALRINPAIPDAHRNLAIAYEKTGHPEQAASHRERASRNVGPVKSPP